MKCCILPVVKNGAGHGDHNMTREALLDRITVNPGVCGGKPCVRGTRIDIAILLDGLAEGLTPNQLIDHYPQLTPDDIRAALTYAAELSRESIWKLPPAHEA
jgi:uncharacterized protein (DUF433 family)